MKYQFDLMISYCWAEKTVCKKIFERLITNGYRVWFDEQNMHGDSLTGMAFTIENSQCIIICMSENDEKSFACHHEAEFAYVHQRRILPLVVQPKYKAREWLGFISGALIYVDFNKYEFDKAFGMMEAEMKGNDRAIEHATTQSATDSNKQNNVNEQPFEKKVESKKQVSTMHENKRVGEWTSEDVISWCYTHYLLTFSQLLENYDGASLLQLHNMAKTNSDNDTFRLLQDDCQRIASNGHIKLTLTEFVRFQSELDKRLERDMTQNRVVFVRYYNIIF